MILAADSCQSSCLFGGGAGFFGGKKTPSLSRFNEILFEDLQDQEDDAVRTLSVWRWNGRSVCLPRG